MVLFRVGGAYSAGAIAVLLDRTSDDGHYGHQFTISTLSDLDEILFNNQNA